MADNPSKSPKSFLNTESVNFGELAAPAKLGHTYAHVSVAEAQPRPANSPPTLVWIRPNLVRSIFMGLFDIVGNLLSPWLTIPLVYFLTGLSPKTFTTFGMPMCGWLTAGWVLLEGLIADESFHIWAVTRKWPYPVWVVFLMIADWLLGYAFVFIEYYAIAFCMGSEQEAGILLTLHEIIYFWLITFDSGVFGSQGMKSSGFGRAWIIYFSSWIIWWVFASQAVNGTLYPNGKPGADVLLFGGFLQSMILPFFSSYTFGAPIVERYMPSAPGAFVKTFADGTTKAIEVNLWERAGRLAPFFVIGTIFWYAASYTPFYSLNLILGWGMDHKQVGMGCWMSNTCVLASMCHLFHRCKPFYNPTLTGASEVLQLFLYVLVCTILIIAVSILYYIYFGYCIYPVLFVHFLGFPPLSTGTNWSQLPVFTFTFPNIAFSLVFVIANRFSCPPAPKVATWKPTTVAKQQR